MADPHTDSEPEGGSVQRREHGMRRVSTVTRWTVAAAAAGSAALGLAYTQLLPGTSATPAAAPATGGLPASDPACTQPAPAPTGAPTPVTRRESDDGDERAADGQGERASDDSEQGTAQVQPVAATCPSGTTAPGLNPPTQPPAPAQQAPQTRTGAS
ncbi:hypothetical protein [Kitasatospora sp. NPDC048538]|uniref:hypothetical protein n=1 Tax=unclassified Kitasatospora TaxID=2633591 RepID=UPI0033FB6564